MKTNETHLVNVPTVIDACCVLYNVCEVHGESLNERWIEDSIVMTTGSFLNHPE